MILNTQDSLDQFLKELNSSDTFVMDLETKGLYPYKPKENWIIGLGFYLPSTMRGFYIPIRHLDERDEWLSIVQGINTYIKLDKSLRYSKETKEAKASYKNSVKVLEARLRITERWELHPYNCCLEEIIEQLKPALTDPNKTMVNWNVKFDVEFLNASAPYTIQNKLSDTMLMAHLRHSSGSPFSLDSHAEKYLGENKDTEILVEQGKRAFDARTVTKVYENLDKIPLEIVAKYCIKDCILSHRLQGFYLANNKYPPGVLADLFEETQEFEAAIVKMEMNGLKIDPEETRRNSELCIQRMAEIIEGIKTYHDVPEDFNPGSVNDVRMAIYGRIEGSALQLPTDHANLMEMENPVAQEVALYRTYQKANSSYFSSLLEKETPLGYAHPSFKIHGTVAFRLSGGGGLNFHAIPRGSEIYKVKECVVCEEDEILLELDFSQIELRLIAHISQDPVMVQAYNEGQDLHTLMALKMTGKTEVTKEERSKAKAINFGFPYGMSWQKFKIYAKKDYGMVLTDLQAQRYRDDFFSLYTGIQPCSNRVNRFARNNGYIELWTKKRRYFDREEELHTAFNNWVQGGASELMRISITKLHKAFNYFEEKGVEIPKMMLTVHDSLLLRCKEEKWELWADLVKKTLENFTFRVPIVADFKVGKCWANLKEIK